MIRRLRNLFDDPFKYALQYTPNGVTVLREKRRRKKINNFKTGMHIVPSIANELLYADSDIWR